MDLATNGASRRSSVAAPAATVGTSIASAGGSGSADASAEPVWMAALPDADFHAAPLEPGQRVALHWRPEDAHALAA